MSTFDLRDLRKAFGRFLTGVTIVTTLDGESNPVGFTANSFSSLSLEPPMLLVCPGRFLSSYAIFEGCNEFAVSILAEGQEDVSNIFAGYKGDRFARVDWQPNQSGIPLISGAAAHFSCETVKTVPAGDHMILIGQVTDYQSFGRRGLGYAEGQYFSLGLERLAEGHPARTAGAVAGAIIHFDGRILLERTSRGLRPPQIAVDDRKGVRGTLENHLKSGKPDIELGQAYSVFDDRQSGTHYTYFLASAENDEENGMGKYVNIDELDAAEFTSPAHTALLSRFLLEYRTRDFGLYVGDEVGGEVHSLREGK
ncbi:MAG: flavin reductase family protein [Pseudomonadota bacterium]